MGNQMYIGTIQLNLVTRDWELIHMPEIETIVLFNMYLA